MTIELPHWAQRTPAQQAAYEAGHLDECNEEPLCLLPRYSDPLEQAYYLQGRADMADEREYDDEQYHGGLDD